MLSLDTETTGSDFHHGARPFFVTTCAEGGELTFWQWDVDPFTRQPEIPNGDLKEIQDAIDDADLLVLQNPKFDVTALQTAFKWQLRWDWDKVRDTLLAGHLLASNQPHDLTSMGMQYLGVDIEPFEKRLKVEVEKARRAAKKLGWRTADKDDPDMPSAKASKWKFDMWVPRELAQKLNHASDHPWRTVLADYSNADSALTLPLWLRQEDEIKKRGYWDVYKARLKILRVVYEMERTGVTFSRKRLDELTMEFTAESERAARVCVNVASDFGHELTLPKSGNNKSLHDFAFTKLEWEDERGESHKGLPVLSRSEKTGIPTLDASVMERYLSGAAFSKNSKAAGFIRALQTKRKMDTAVSYMDGYKRFGVPIGDSEWCRLHSSINPTGTDTTRFSSSNPNAQNVSKKEDSNLRYVFGPTPGREWWTLDGKNIELRLPAYEAGEDVMIYLFEHPDEPPYFGSNHLLVFDLLHPEKFAKHGVEVKKVYASTWYQWVKQGNFAVQYGAMDKADGTGTADLSYRVPGAHAKVKSKFAKQERLSRDYIEKAKRLGYVETIPDKTVDPEHGYPLLCARSAWGRIEPTKPFSYHIQGTVGQWMVKAMIRCQEQLDKWNLEEEKRHHKHANGYLSGSPTRLRVGYLSGYKMSLQVHDELLFDFPRGQGKYPHLTNYPKIEKIRDLMEMGGDDIGIPTPVSISYHLDNWSVEIPLTTQKDDGYMGKKPQIPTEGMAAMDRQKALKQAAAGRLS